MKIYVIEAQCPQCKVLWKLQVNEGTTEQLCQTCTVPLVKEKLLKIIDRSEVWE